MSTNEEVDLDELERLAGYATPGPWCTDASCPGRVYCDDATGTQVLDCGPFMYVARAKPACEANAAFAAAVGPNVVLSLIQRIRELEEELRGFEDSRV
jgi:hypothetical protein